MDSHRADDGPGPCATRSRGLHPLSRRKRRAVAPFRSPLAMFLPPGFWTDIPGGVPSTRGHVVSDCPGSQEEGVRVQHTL